MLVRGQCSFLFSIVNSVFIISCPGDIQKHVSSSKYVISFSHGHDLSLSNLPLSIETHMHTSLIYLFICILKLHVIFFFFLNNTLVFRRMDKFRIRGILRWLKTYGIMVLLQCVLIVVVQYTTWTWTPVPWDGVSLRSTCKILLM